eukprot:TRINITY_DN822_c0_g1_i8.p1 TRINITY_DN822_c0_g1~~TRINITY_DN822_c0_g1_i8.p1  ORF type:complete len:153 (+),score=5.95 TRINITY_DN822_c0_g1_i8:428-886(+)
MFEIVCWVKSVNKSSKHVANLACRPINHCCRFLKQTDLLSSIRNDTNSHSTKDNDLAMIDVKIPTKKLVFMLFSRLREFDHFNCHNFEQMLFDPFKTHSHLSFVNNFILCQEIWDFLFSFSGFRENTDKIVNLGENNSDFGKKPEKSTVFIS